MVGRLFKKQHPSIGARPGTLAIPKAAPTPIVKMMDFRGDELNHRDVDDATVLKAALKSESITWVDVQGFGDKSFLDWLD